MRREDRAERSGALVPRCPGWGRQEQAGQVRHEGGEDRAVAGSPECCGPHQALRMPAGIFAVHVHGTCLLEGRGSHGAMHGGLFLGTQPSLPEAPAPAAPGLSTTPLPCPLRI